VAVGWPLLMRLRALTMSSPAQPGPLPGGAHLPPRRIGAPWARRILLALAALLALGVTGASVWMARLQAALQRERAAIRARGEPLTLREIAPPPVPAAQNGGPLYLQAKTPLSKDEETRLLEWSRRPGSFPGAITEATAERLLARCAGALALTHQASRKPAARFEVRWADGIDAQFPHYAHLRRLARLLSARAVLHARRGRMDAALEDVAAMYRMSDHLGEEPTLIGLLVRIAIEAIANATLGRVLEEVSVTAAQAARMRERLPRIPMARTHVAAAIGERAMGLSVFDGFRADRRAFPRVPGAEGTRRTETPRPLGPIIDLNELVYLQALRRHIDAARLDTGPTPQPSPLERGIDDLPGYPWMTVMLLPVFSEVVEKRDGAITHQKMIPIALALAVHRSSTGRYPAQLDALSLSASVLTDPYSGRPFLYRREGDRYVLYSIGPNRLDDGGETFLEVKDLKERERRKKELDDILWMLRPPKP
jgi:hypothetical protein